MTATQAQIDFGAKFTQFVGGSLDFKALHAFLSGLKFDELKDCFTTYFDAAARYSAKTEKVNQAFYEMAMLALRKGSVHFALRLEVWIDDKSTKWNQHHERLSRKRQSALKGAINRAKQTLTATERAFLKVFADYMRKPNAKALDNFFYKLKGPQYRDCLNVYIEVSQAYHDDNRDSLTVFYAFSVYALARVDASFADDYARKVSSPGMVWHTRFSALQDYQREKITQTLAERRAKLGDGAKAATKPHVEKTVKLSKKQKEFQALFEAFMKDNRKFKEMTEFAFALRDPKDRIDCLMAYMDASLKYADDDKASLYAYYGTLALMLANTDTYQSMKYEYLITTADTVWKRRHDALSQDQRNDIAVTLRKQKRDKMRLIDMLKFDFYKKHHRDPSMKDLREHHCDISNDQASALDRVIGHLDVAYDADNLESFVNSCDAFGALLSAQKDSLVMMAWLHRCRDAKIKHRTLREELCWFIVAMLYTHALKSNLIAYFKGFNDEEKELFIDVAGRKGAYYDDFLLRMDYVIDKRSNDAANLCKSHAALLVAANKFRVRLAPMIEAAKVKKKLDKLQKETTKSVTDIVIPVNSRWDHKATVHLGQTLGHFYIVWWDEKTSTAYIEIEGLERILFSVDSYYRLGQIRDDDAFYGEVYRRTKHLLVAIPFFFQIISYLPDLISGGFFGLARAIVIDILADEISDGAIGQNIAISMGLDLLTSRRPDIDDMARAISPDARRVARVADSSALKPSQLDATVNLPLQHRLMGGADDVVHRGGAAADDVAARASSAVKSPHGTTTAGAVLPATSAMDDAAKAAARATPPAPKPQLMLPAPKYPPSVLDTAKQVGLEPEQVRVLGELIGGKLTRSDLKQIGAIWNRARKAHADEIKQIEAMYARGAVSGDIAAQAREVFGKVRDDFWQQIRNGSDASAIAIRSRFDQAGVTFLGSANAPIVTMKTSEGWSNVQIQVDHVAELGKQPMKAFSPENLRFAFAGENTVVLEKLHSMDPFLPDARLGTSRSTSRAGQLQRGPRQGEGEPFKGGVPPRTDMSRGIDDRALQQDINQAIDHAIQALDEI